MNRILLVGGYGYLDLGDESQLTAVLNNLKKSVPNAHLVVLSASLENTCKYHDVDSDFSLKYYLDSPFFMKRKKQDVAPKLQKTTKLNPVMSVFKKALSVLDSFLITMLLIFNAQRLRDNKKPLFLDEGLKRFLNNLKNCSLLFCVGGGNLTSVWKTELHRKCLTFFLCRIFDKPVILSGQTIGPFYGLFDRLVARYVLNQVNVITLREKFSKVNLQNVGVTKPLIRVTADDSVTLIPESQQQVKQVFEAEEIKVRHPLIGLNIIGLQYLKAHKSKLNKAKKLLAKIADKLIDDYNATILFVPMQYGVDGDRAPIAEVLQLMKNRGDAFVLSNDYDDNLTKGVIGTLDLAIGFRYHFNVFAVTSGVPAIGIYLDDYYATKIRGIFSLMNQDKYAISIEQTNFEKLMELIKETLSNKEQISQSLSQRTEALQKQSTVTIELAKLLTKQE